MEPSHQSHYPSAHDYTYDPRDHYASSYPEETHFHRRRSPSRTPSLGASEGIPSSTQQPLKNALNNAFDKSDSARTVDPELIAQITAEVKRSVLDEIKLSGMGGSTSPAPPQQSFPPSTTSIPPRNVYTPPSPKHADVFSHHSASPEPHFYNPAFDENDTPTPRREQTAPVNISQERAASRPAPVRMATEETYTPIEKMWQRLFDLQGQPTPRLGQFLRGLAVHLIEDYEPKNSLVISPAKMLQFYEDVKLDEEIYPWSRIFGKLPYSALSKIYRDLRCQHHFVQERITDEPRIPALTPEGFQEWMTAMIQAYPSTEYQRLSKAVLDLPISNADDRKERFPKELPRRLFPHSDNLQAQQRCAAVLSAEGVGPLRKAPTFPPPPPLATQPTAASASFERERSPYASKPPDQAIESDEEPISRPIERERKPYSAAPGGGKLYEDEQSRSTPPDASLNQQRRRTQSTASQSQWNPPPPRTTNPQTTAPRHRSPSFSGYGTRSDPNVRDVPSSFYNANLYDTPMTATSEEENMRFAKDAEMRRNEWSDRHASVSSEGERAHRRRGTAGTDGSGSYDSQPRSASVYDDEYYRGRNGSGGYEGRGYEGRRY